MNQYTNACKRMSLVERQVEFSVAWQKAEAAATLCDFATAEFYLDTVVYLSLFVIVDECLDAPKRRAADVGGLASRGRFEN